MMNKADCFPGPGYVALARLEEVAGKINQARKVISRGCELCPRSIVVVSTPSSSIKPR
jgi:pre-mRNA-processing factor 6